ncbi:MAG: DUF2339 domain-containing protein [Hymenobacteraceae bacterium]|nr:DUF2339 domain-containing protein [Hymenobacteraceae bacterium]
MDEPLLARTIATLRQLPPEQLRTVAEFAEFARQRSGNAAESGVTLAALPSPITPPAAVPARSEPPLGAQLAGPALPRGSVLPPPPNFPPARPAADWERFAGENLAARLGIAALVLGVGFFVKYAFDTDLLGPLAQVLGGVGIGGLLILTGHWQRRAVPALASVLTGGGVAVLYLSGTLAFQQYQLISQPVAFGLMAAVTLLAGALAVYYDRAELAVVALVGGFAAPLLLRTGVARWPALFTYVLLLDAGALALALYRRWPALARVAWPATAVLFGGWVVNQVVGQPRPIVAGPLGFGTALVALFLGYAVAAARRGRGPTAPIDRILILAQAAGAALAGEALVAHWPSFLAHAALWFRLTVAFAAAGQLARLAPADAAGVAAQNAVADALWTAALGLLTVGVAMVFSRFTLTLVWALEALALLAIGLRLKARRVRVTGLALFALTLGKLVVLDAWAFSPGQRVVAFGVVGALLLAGSFLYQRLRALVEAEAGEK